MINPFLLMAVILAICGTTWLALAMDVHWKQVCKGLPSARVIIVLRILGAAALFGSLVLCLKADHATMAALVWIMLLAVSAMSVAFLLNWCPRLLSVLVIWIAFYRS